MQPLSATPRSDRSPRASVRTGTNANMPTLRGRSAGCPRPRGGGMPRHHQPSTKKFPPPHPSPPKGNATYSAPPPSPWQRPAECRVLYFRLHDALAYARPSNQLPSGMVAMRRSYLLVVCTLVAGKFELAVCAFQVAFRALAKPCGKPLRFLYDWLGGLRRCLVLKTFAA